MDSRPAWVTHRESVSRNKAKQSKTAKSLRGLGEFPPVTESNHGSTLLETPKKALT